MAVKNDANRAFDGTKDEVHGSTSQAFGQAKEAVAQVAGQAKETAQSQLEEQKGRVANGVGNIAQALRQTSQNLDGQGSDTVSNYVGKAAEMLDSVSRQFREKDVNELVDDAVQFARREPALFLGGAFAIGILAARFLKSSSPRGEVIAQDSDQAHWRNSVRSRNDGRWNDGRAEDAIGTGEAW